MTLHTWLDRATFGMYLLVLGMILATYRRASSPKHAFRVLMHYAEQRGDGTCLITSTSTPGAIAVTTDPDSAAALCDLLRGNSYPTADDADQPQEP